MKVIWQFVESFAGSFVKLMARQNNLHFSKSFVESFAGSFVKLMARPNNLHFL
jgi:hypothetical protein